MRLKDVQYVTKGTFGILYKARVEPTARIVGVKVIRPSASVATQRRFQEEIGIVSRLNHPNVIEVIMHGRLDGGAFSGQPCFAMPFYERGSLATDWRNIATDATARNVFIDGLIDGLDYSHSKGVWHRDLKPENCLLSGNGNCVIADFGCAFWSRRDKLATRLTGTGHVLGTMAYMAPELFHGAKYASPQSDFYAFGRIFYECLVGERGLPFSDQNIPPGFDELFAGCFHPVASRRFLSALHLRAAFNLATGRIPKHLAGGVLNSEVFKKVVGRDIITTDRRFWTNADEVLMRTLLLNESDYYNSERVRMVFDAVNAFNAVCLVYHVGNQDIRKDWSKGKQDYANCILALKRCLELSSEKAVIERELKEMQKVRASTMNWRGSYDMHL